MIRLHNVRLRRGHKTILSIDDWHAPRHAFVQVIGPNGAGKTTLLNVIAGLVGCPGGSVAVAGVALSAGRRSAQARSAIGYVPQAAAYNAHVPFTVREVVSLAWAGQSLWGSGGGASPAAFRQRRQQRRAAVERWLERLGLADLAERTFRSLSGGEQRKVMIVRALVREPALLLLDEPTANLDFDWRWRLLDEIEQLYAAGGLTVVMVSHDTVLLPACCTHVALLADGCIRAAGPPAEVLSGPAIGDVYATPLQATRLGGRWCLVPQGGPSVADAGDTAVPAAKDGSSAHG